MYVYINVYTDTYIYDYICIYSIIYIYISWHKLPGSTGFSQKTQPSTKKFQHAPEAPGPLYQCNHRFSMAGARIAVFLKSSDKALPSHNIEIGGPGVSYCPRVLARIQVKLAGRSFEEPSMCIWRTRYVYIGRTLVAALLLLIQLLVENHQPPSIIIYIYVYICI